MRSVAIVLLFAVLVSAHPPSHFEDPSQGPTNPVPEECRSRVDPLQQVLHKSLHDQRHVVHQECRLALRSERENHRRERANLMGSLAKCHELARSMRASDPKEAADLVRQCDDTAAHLLQDRAYVEAIAQVHKSCNYNLRQVNVRVRESAVRLISILTTCSRPHACYMYRMIKNSILTNVDQIHSDATGDVMAICRRPNLIHHLRRSCERFNLTSNILVEVETTIPRSLHVQLSELCAEPFSPHRTTPEPTHAVKTKKIVAPTTRVATRRVVPTRPVAPTTEEEVEAPEMPDLNEVLKPIHEELEEVHDFVESPTTEKPGLPGWNDLLGVGPVLVDPAKLEKIGKKLSPEQDKEQMTRNNPNEHAPSKHHHHGSHHSLTVGMIATVGVLCVIVTVLSAALTMMILRRRAVRAGPNARELKVPLTDADQLDQIKSKGFENPTYAFFEGTEE